MNIVAPRPIKTTAETVTLSRAEWEAHLDRLDDEADRASVLQSRAERERLGEEEYRRLCYTSQEVARLGEGISVVTIWRERAGLSRQALAAAANVSAGDLAEIEAGQKPGSAAALSRLAKVLRVPIEHLVADDEMLSPSA